MMRQGLWALCLGCLFVLPAAAQDLFTAVATVNGTVITRYEVQQRVAFLTALHQPGDSEQMALDGLISDRLELDVAKQVGIKVSPDDLTAGMTEYASRANLSLADFVKAIGESGVEPETFRDFVEAGVIWRMALHAKFGGQIVVSDAEIDRAIAGGIAAGGSKRVLMSEIVLQGDGKTNVGDLARRIRDSVKSEGDFEQKAQIFSKVGSAGGGGQLGWIDLSALPPAIVNAVGKLKVGEMSQPVVQQGGVSLYYMRDVSMAQGTGKPAAQVDYAVFSPPAGTNLAAVQAGTMDCQGLNIAARGMSAAALQRQTSAESALPANLRGAVAGLDGNESAIVTGANGLPALVMVCARMPATEVPASRDDVRIKLVNQKLTLLADAWLEELRSDAIIVRQ